MYTKRQDLRHLSLYVVTAMADDPRAISELLSALERVYADNARLETRLTRYVLVSSTIVGLIAALGLAAKWL